MIISIMITMIIILLLVGGTPTPGELIMMVCGLTVAFVVLTALRNRFADGLASVFLGAGDPASSAAELMTDRAEGYFQQQEYDTALYEFEQALRRARGAHRPRLMLRLAETAVLADHAEEALRWWREALQSGKKLNDEERAGALFRMAEVLQTRMGDPRGAAKLLAQVHRDYPGTRYATYAEERLRSLTQERLRT